MLYAAYGSNLHPLRLSLRLPNSRFKGTAAIAGLKLCFHKKSKDQSGKCNIVAGDDSIHVAGYELGGAEKDRLDHIEGTGSGSIVETLEVPGFGTNFTHTHGTKSWSWWDAARWDYQGTTLKEFRESSQSTIRI
jgi:hypothetical protein